MSTIVIFRWYIYDLYLDYQVSFLDRDNDGMWSGVEQETWSEEEIKYYNAHFADGGRNVFAIFMFPIFSFIYSTLSISIYWIILKVRRRRNL
jgi:hypothetical protein